MVIETSLKEALYYLHHWEVCKFVGRVDELLNVKIT